AIAEGKPINVFNRGEMSRDFTYIDDIIEGIHIIVNNPPKKNKGASAYSLANIGNGAPESLKDFIDVIELNLNKKAKRVLLPMQPGDVSTTWADITYLKELGFKSKTKIDDGVKKFIEWFKEYEIAKLRR